MASSPVTAKTWELVGSLFDRLASLPPEDRALDTLDQPESVRELVEKMLAAHDTSDPQLLDQTVSAIAGQFVAAQAPPRQPVDYRGRRFGAWRVLEEISHGGMAVVLRGERADGQFQKEVAIKLLPEAPRGVERDRLLEEIRILARLEHPNIARLIDGGVSENDEPYLVMEYVRGERITDYCRERRLDQGAKLSLLLQVIEAVQFAHRHLIVHCDIKPDNILVTEDGQAKLVDFGIAGLISSGTMETGVPRGLFFSPAYCAPEQIRGDSPNTAQDIFSLGAVLYELLCGQRLRDNPTVTRLLLHQETGDKPLVPPSRQGGRRPIDRDLDAICLKCLAGDPAARYPTASDLLADIQRWLAREPVTARAAGRIYRAGKWFRRHWLPAATGAIAVLAMIVGSAVSLWQAQQARSEAALAQSVQAFLLDMFSGVDPWKHQQEPLNLDEFLDAAIADLPNQLEQHPAQRAEILTFLGDIMHRLGRGTDALGLHRQAAEIWREEGHHPALWQSQVKAGQAALDEFQFDGLEDRLTEVIGQAPWPPVHSSAVRARVLKVELLTRTGGHEEQQRLIDELLAATDAIERLPESDVLLGEIFLSAAEAVENQARYDQAVEYAHHAADYMERAYGAGHPGIGKAMSYIATSRYAQGRYSEALDAMERSLAIDLTYYGDDHPQTLWSRYTRSRILLDAGRFEAASGALTEIVDILIRLHGPDDPRLGVTYANLGKAWRGLGDLEQSLEWYARGLEITQANEPDHPKVGTYYSLYAQAMSEAGDLDEANRLFARGLSILEEKLGREHPDTAAARVGWAGHLVRRDRAEEAIEIATDALQVLQGRLDAGSYRVSRAHQALGNALYAHGESERAREHWQSSLSILQDGRYRDGYRLEREALLGRLGD